MPFFIALALFLAFIAFAVFNRDGLALASIVAFFLVFVFAMIMRV